MNFVEYSPLALRTAKPLEHDAQVDHALLGLITEVGELGDNIKKHIIYGKPRNNVNVMEECADIFWYANLYMNEMRLHPGMVDDLWARFGSDAAEKAAQFDPMLGIKCLAGLTGALTQPANDRGVSDRECVEQLVMMTHGFVIWSGHTLSQALLRNIAKLAKRYGDKFSEERALNRDLAAELKILEGNAS